MSIHPMADLIAWLDEKKVEEAVRATMLAHVAGYYVGKHARELNINVMRGLSIVTSSLQTGAKAGLSGTTAMEWATSLDQLAAVREQAAKN